MVRADTIKLVGESPAAHGVFDTPTETATEVFCTVQSVGFREFYEAKSAGLEPDIVFNLTNAEDYSGEKIVLWKDVRYRVIRTYLNGMGIDITCEKITNDRGEVKPSGSDSNGNAETG
ncbi:MAG: hypothetical protein IIZ78_11110 [Clostridiales bacterium]|nr:hypothetical protein [Clostridiales bacterium]